MISNGNFVVAATALMLVMCIEYSRGKKSFRISSQNILIINDVLTWMLRSGKEAIFNISM